MRKILFCLTALLTVFCLAACTFGGSPADDGKIRIVTTIFPEYDWVKSVLGDNPGDAEVVLLLDNGVDLHSYQPTAEDILKISTCDLFIYVGGESDGWVKNALSQAVNKDMIVINLMEVLGDKAKVEELVEGMEHDHDHDHEDGDHDHDHDEEPEYDEHVWLSLRYASILTQAISEAIVKIDCDHADVYKKNTADYIAKLTELDGRFKDMVAQAPRKTLLFGDRFPFRYLTDDYDLKYFAAFSGCSAETEASFETIAFLAGKVDEQGLSAVMTIDGADKKIAETVVANTKTKDQKILSLDSLQSTTSKDAANGKTYLSAMENNLKVLTEALK
ncbi:MAG: zinc ABC transporter substrate-binding protein [Lachnospiraceae bacterium]|nr:zinc ABC transporter substrate-binding protein [Lachnospiraceae bacterium]